MKDSYVNNIEEILIANETQKNKIQFLERERLKRDHYLDDLKQNLLLNKQTMREMNNKGPNLEAVDKLIKQTDHLSQKLKQYYEEYQSINALLLMQKQMRLEDKRFYSERIVEFENKMVDLRKYLHDKEDSFSSVVARLKKYQDLAENTMDDKLSNFKKQIGERHVNQFIAQILKEKNFYRNEYEKIMKIFVGFDAVKKEICEQHPKVNDILSNYDAESKQKYEQMLRNVYLAHEVIQEKQKEMKEKEKKKSKIEPNKELIRLLKKQKLSKELHQEALNDAIEKNQELISIKDIYEKNLEKLENKCKLLYAENTLFALRLAEYDTHYCRYVTHHEKFYEEGEPAGLRAMTQGRLKQYAKKVEQFFESDSDLYKKYGQKLKSQVQKWGEFICDSPQIRTELLKKPFLTKSCSVPRLIVNFQLDEYEETQKMIIEEY